MADVPEWFCKLMLWAAEAFPNAQPREGTFRIYYAVLGDLSPEQVRAAFLHAIKDSGTDFFPSAPKVRSYAVPSADDAGLLAWTALGQAAGTVGAYQSLDCDDAAVVVAVRAVFGSWPEFCSQAVDVPTGAWLAKRGEFIAAYRDARRNAPTGQPSRLDGLLESHLGEHVWVGKLLPGGPVSQRETAQLGSGKTVSRLTD